MNYLYYCARYVYYHGDDNATMTFGLLFVPELNPLGSIDCL